MVQAIIDRNRKAAKAEQEKSALAGFAIAFVGFQLVATFGLHLQSGQGIDLYRLGGAALCGAIGGAIGNWFGRPTRRK